MYTIRTKRIYTAVDTGDGYRVLAGPALAAWNQERGVSARLLDPGAGAFNGT